MDKVDVELKEFQAAMDSAAAEEMRLHMKTTAVPVSKQKPRHSPRTSDVSLALKNWITAGFALFALIGVIFLMLLLAA